LTLEVRGGDLGWKHWDFWVYPDAAQETDASDILITDQLTDDVEKKLEAGARVLLKLDGRIRDEKGGDIAAGFSPALKPLIQMIDTWSEARKLGLLFEGKVGQGRLVVTSIDFKRGSVDRLAARQLYRRPSPHGQTQGVGDQTRHGRSSVYGHRVGQCRHHRKGQSSCDRRLRLSFLGTPCALSVLPVQRHPQEP